MKAEGLSLPEAKTIWMSFSHSVRQEIKAKSEEQERIPILGGVRQVVKAALTAEAAKRMKAAKADPGRIPGQSGTTRP